MKPFLNWSYGRGLCLANCCRSSAPLTAASSSVRSPEPTPGSPPPRSEARCATVQTSIRIRPSEAFVLRRRLPLTVVRGRGRVGVRCRRLTVCDDVQLFVSGWDAYRMASAKMPMRNRLFHFPSALSSHTTLPHRPKTHSFRPPFLSADPPYQRVFSNSSSVAAHSGVLLCQRQFSIATSISYCNGAFRSTSLSLTTVNCKWTTSQRWKTPLCNFEAAKGLSVCACFVFSSVAPTD